MRVLADGAAVERERERLLVRGRSRRGASGASGLRGTSSVPSTARWTSGSAAAACTAGTSVSAERWIAARNESKPLAGGPAAEGSEARCTEVSTLPPAAASPSSSWPAWRCTACLATSSGGKSWPASVSARWMLESESPASASGAFSPAIGARCGDPATSSSASAGLGAADLRRFDGLLGRGLHGLGRRGSGLGLGCTLDRRRRLGGGLDGRHGRGRGLGRGRSSGAAWVGAAGVGAAWVGVGVSAVAWVGAAGVGAGAGAGEPESTAARWACSDEFVRLKVRSGGAVGGRSGLGADEAAARCATSSGLIGAPRPIRRIPVDGARCTGGAASGCAGAAWVGSVGVGGAAGVAGSSATRCVGAGGATGSSAARWVGPAAGSAGDGTAASAAACTGAEAQTAAGTTDSSPPAAGARCANSSGAPGRPFGGIGGSEERKATGATTGRAPTVGAVVAGARCAGKASGEVATSSADAVAGAPSAGEVAASSSAGAAAADSGSSAGARRTSGSDVGSEAAAGSSAR